ncbi:MAG TPA: PKD domain-containing protein, partial [Methanospirillum sp.]|uniref:PKD domain-containing protein n=1 Tax=Methanospirillum sp. TaxID=45200 RepID=UPI002B95CEF3
MVLPRTGDKWGNMRIDSYFKYPTRGFFILLTGLVCISLLTLNVSALPGPAPEFSGPGIHQSNITSGNDTTPVLQPAVKSQTMALSAQEVKASRSSTTSTVSSLKDTTGINVTWQKCYGGSSDDTVSSIIRTADGGSIFCGYTNSTDGNISGFHGNYDYWIVKFAANGSIEWQKNLGGSDIDVGMSVNQTPDKGYLITGYSYSTDGNVTGNHGADDSWILKLSSIGTTEWSNSLGGSKHDWGWSGIQTADTGYLVIGGTGSQDGNVSGNHGDYDGWIQKINANGTLQWQKCLGGSNLDELTSVIQTPEGGYLTAGRASSTDGDVVGNHGGYDAWIVCLNTTVGLKWQKCLGGSGDDYVASLIKTKDGGYLIGGYTNSTDGNVSGNHGNNDAWVVKLDADGNLKWQKCLGGSGDDAVESVIQDSDSGYLIAGYTSSDDGDVSGYHGDYDAWIVKLDADGNLKWQKCLGGTGEDDAISIIQISNDRYLVAGYTSSNDGDVSGNHGGYDAWIVDIQNSDSTKTVDMESLLSQPGPNGGTSMLGSVDNWSLNALSTVQSNSTSGSSDTIQVSFTANTIRGSAPLTVAFTSTCQGNPTAYSWNFGDGKTSGEINPTHTYTVPGTYSVTLKAMNANSGAIGVLPDLITVTDGRLFSKKYQAPGTA